jgi:hypothetical protein
MFHQSLFYVIFTFNLESLKGETCFRSQDSFLGTIILIVYVEGHFHLPVLYLYLYSSNKDGTAEYFNCVS